MTKATFNILHDENNFFVNHQEIEFKSHLENQNDALDELEKGLTRLGKAGREINEEIKIQSNLIDNLDEDIDTAHNKIGKMNNMLNKSLYTKNKCNGFWTIFCLCIILFILIFLVIWL
jgi:t-SNARE complex subunit (syntaxin)